MENRIYLNSYALQQDMRVRMPKAILENISAQKGKTIFDVYFDPDKGEIILKSLQIKSQAEICEL